MRFSTYEDEFNVLQSSIRYSAKEVVKSNVNVLWIERLDMYEFFAQKYFFNKSQTPNQISSNSILKKLYPCNKICFVIFSQKNIINEILSICSQLTTR